MSEDPITTAELLTAWRDATRAAELADRLAQIALEAADRADSIALGSEEIADLAEQAAASATRAAERARAAAVQAREAAREGRQDRLPAAEATVTETHSLEQAARDLFQTAEAETKRLDADRSSQG
jgi:hypothetical protein